MVEIVGFYVDEGHLVDSEVRDRVEIGRRGDAELTDESHW